MKTTRYLAITLGLAILVAGTIVTEFACADAAHPRIRYEYATGELARLCNQAIESTKSKVEALKKLPKEERSFKNTILAFEEASADYQDKILPLTFMAYVSTNEALSAEGAKCEENAGTFGASLATDRDLYLVLKDGKANLESSSTTPSAIDQRLAYWTLLSFEKNGMNLPTEQLAKVSKLMQELATLTAKFSDNLNKDKSSIKVKKEDLKGLPEDFISSLTVAADGTITIATKRDAYDKIMQNAANPETRKKMLIAWNNKAAVENTKLLEEAVQLRQKIAKELGFKTWADYQINGRMAKDSATVLQFLNSLRGKLAIKNDEILKTLLIEKKKEHPTANIIDAWDPLYYITQYKKNVFSIDEEAIAEYLPAQTVMKGVFEIYSTLFNVKFKEVKNAKVWADGVSLYRVVDAKTGKTRAYFYIDLYPRQGKYGHFAAFPLISGRMMKDGKYSYPLASMVGNFPTPQGNKPSLLTHDMAETFFHEFGHIMHQTLTTVPYASLSGSSVLQDFVEAPSQMLENWDWNAEILNKISGHYKDPSKKLPKEMIDKLIGAKTFDAGYAYTRQLLFGLYDMNIHMQNGPVDVNATFDQMYREISKIEPPENNHFPAGFGHLMGGYDAGYYGYLWSKVYAEDMFSRFEKEGLMNAEVGLQYRDRVLSQGNSRDPMDLLRDFLGREPNMDAFYRSIGL